MADNPLLITDADITGVLKNVYAKYRVDAFPIITPLLAQVKKGTSGGPERLKWSGAGVYWDVKLDRAVGGAYSTAGYLPPHAEARERQATLGITRAYVRRQIDMLSILGTESAEGAFVPLARKVMEEAVDAGRLLQEETLHGDARGIKALVGSVTDTTHIVVTSPYGVASAGEGGLLLGVGQYVAVLDTSAADVVLGRAEITQITNSGDNATLTLGTAVAGMAAADKVVAATESDTSFNSYANGLLNITNYDGSTYDSFEGISAATFTNWDATQLVAGTDSDFADRISEMDVWKLARKVAGKSGKDAVSKPSEFLLLTTPGIFKKVAESFLGQRAFDSANFMDIKGGFKAINISGIAMIQDQWCPAGHIYLIHIPSLTWVDLQDWTKVQYQDSGAVRPIAGRDAFEFSLGLKWNFGALQRNSHGVFTGFVDTERYSHV